MNESSAINFQTLAIWATLVIGVLSGVGTLITRSLTAKDEQLSAALRELDDQVQKNTQLALEPVRQALNAAKESTTEKRADDLQRIERLENILLKQVLNVQTKS